MSASVDHAGPARTAVDGMAAAPPCDRQERAWEGRGIGVPEAGVGSGGALIDGLSGVSGGGPSKKSPLLALNLCAVNVHVAHGWHSRDPGCCGCIVFKPGS